MRALVQRFAERCHGTYLNSPFKPPGHDSAELAFLGSTVSAWILITIFHCILLQCIPSRLRLIPTTGERRLTYKPAINCNPRGNTFPTSRTGTEPHEKLQAHHQAGKTFFQTTAGHPQHRTIQVQNANRALSFEDLPAVTKCANLTAAKILTRHDAPIRILVRVVAMTLPQQTVKQI